MRYLKLFEDYFDKLINMKKHGEYKQIHGQFNELDTKLVPMKDYEIIKKYLIKVVEANGYMKRNHNTQEPEIKLLSAGRRFWSEFEIGVGEAEDGFFSIRKPINFQIQLNNDDWYRVRIMNTDFTKHIKNSSEEYECDDILGLFNLISNIPNIVKNLE